MKTIHVPYIKNLDNADIAVAAELLNEIGARDAVESVNWLREFPYKPITFFHIARSAKSLFIKYFVHGNVLKAVYADDQNPVNEDSCVEFFVKLPESEYYSHFEFNCIGTCLAKKRKSRNEDVQPYSQKELTMIQRFPSLDKRTFNEIEGLFEWELTVEIPFTLLSIDPQHLPAKLMGNFYKCADKTDSEHYVSWNPVKTERPDFHRPEFFGEIWL